MKLLDIFYSEMLKKLYEKFKQAIFITKPYLHVHIFFFFVKFVIFWFKPVKIIRVNEWTLYLALIWNTNYKMTHFKARNIFHEEKCNPVLSLFTTFWQPSAHLTVSV